MEFDKTLDKWFDETFTMYQKKVHPPKPVDHLMIGILQYSRHCSVTTFSLLEREAKLSSMVLLRVYLELFIKFRWCLINDPASKKNRKDEVYSRFRQWDFKRLIEQRKLLKKELKVIEKSTKPEAFNDRKSEICIAIGKVEGQIKKYEKQGLGCIPNPWKMLEDISEEKTQYLPEDILRLYPKLYQRFCKAVHPDMDFIRRMVINRGDAYVCSSDVNEDVHELKLYLFAMSCDIIRKIRDFYGWDSAEVQKEYDLMVKQLNG